MIELFMMLMIVFALVWQAIVFSKISKVPLWGKILLWVCAISAGLVTGIGFFVELGT